MMRGNPLFSCKEKYIRSVVEKRCMCSDETRDEGKSLYHGPCHSRQTPSRRGILELMVFRFLTSIFRLNSEISL